MHIVIVPSCIHRFARNFFSIQHFYCKSLSTNCKTAKMESKDYIIVCPQQKLDFRVPELQSVANMFGFDLTIRSKNPIDSPFVQVHATAQQIESIMSRSVMASYAIELWGSGYDWNDLHTRMKELGSDFFSPYRNEDATFKFCFDAFGQKVAPERRKILIEKSRYLGFQGKVDMKTPKNIYYFLEDHGHAEPFSLKKAFFGRLVATGQRGVINEYNLRTRKLIGNTAMDPELSFIMSNMGWAQKHKVVFDPFVGTGSLLYASAHFGSFVSGTDLNRTLLHGRGNTSRAKTEIKWRLKDENMLATFAQYGTQGRFLGVCVADQSKPPWARHCLFDSIITDPPYGIREGAKKDKGGFVKEQYNRTNVFEDLLDFAARMLVLNGRLVYWLPVLQDEYDEKQVPRHPCLKIIANSEQRLKGNLARRLITMQKHSGWNDASGRAATEAPLLDFREKVFAKST
eukprot:m.98149 g.98149  ORF g.98149 m.98149 type:complete len:457 (+) comp13625_c0_seq8:105-1475(+)